MQTTNVSVLAQSGQTAPSLSQATLTELPSDGIEIPGQVLGRFSEASGLLVCEARTPWISVSFEVWKGDELLFTYTPQMEIRPVKEMYSWFNFRQLSGGTAERPSVTHVLADERNTKSLVFLHGANVSEVDAEAWGDALFKRLWLSGVKADFYNVDWRSNIGGAADYHANASNAFVVAGQIASTIQDIPGEKVLMAHSLGNMVVSSMIQDHHLRVSRYLMCNSAVPAEAYDPAMDHTAVLQHKDWDDYPAKARANEWYRLFDSDPDDARGRLTWSGRFADVVDVAVNFYSTGDHVLELERNNNVWAVDGYENWQQKFERFSWHKQELWKGRKGVVARIGTTDWSGWSFRENILGMNVISPTNAWLMSKADLRTNTVFRLQPTSMNSNPMSLLVQGAHLAQGISARTPASGATRWGGANMAMRMVDLQSSDESSGGLSRPNGWIARPNGLLGDWGDRWLHSDMKDMSYYYVYRFFEKVKELGGLQ